MDIIADKMIFGGDCIGHIEGKTVFVSGMLPGETAEIAITQEKKDFCRAKVRYIKEMSPHRVQPVCPYYGSCGGCNLQIANDSYQRTLRLSILQDSFLRSLGRAFCENPEHAKTIEVINAAQVVYDRPLGYRSRFQFHNGGLKKNNSDEIIPIDSCPVATEAVQTLLSSGTLSHMKGRVHVFDDTVAVEDPRCKDLSQTISVTVQGKPLTFDVRGFFQSNIPMLEKTLDLIKKSIDTYSDTNGNMLDMYCGVGTFSAFFASRFQKSVLVEHNRHAIEYARKNVQAAADYFALSGEEFCSKKAGAYTFDTVIIDPPRSGMEKPVLQWLCTAKPKNIFSVSCDPVTHGRDAKQLLEAGYVLKSLYLLDFYPQTSHIESYAEYVLHE
ncbi:MAG: methyltransferase [Treponemataceae bacterium]|nr:methyltransferase [Treponemataceae bacterium]